jgi:hypothetical protein
MANKLKYYYHRQQYSLYTSIGVRTVESLLCGRNWDNGVTHDIVLYIRYLIALDTLHREYIISYRRITY